MSEDATSAIPDLIDKYMRMLDCPGDGPVVEIRDNLGSKWLCRCTWHPSRPRMTTIEVQKIALDDPRTLERIIAHEVIHHSEYAELSDADLAMLKLGRRSYFPEHGAEFRRKARLVNDAMGEDFVTERSDTDFVVGDNAKEFFLLVEPARGGRVLGWSWAAKLSPGASGGRAEVQRREAEGAKLVMATDARWTRGVKIKRFGGCSVPKAGSEDEKVLREIWDEAGGQC